MAIPLILASSSLQDSTTVTSRVLPLPDGCVTGSLLVGMGASSGSSTPSITVGNWDTEGGGIQTNHRHFFFTKYVDGTEGSSVTINTTNASKGNWLLLRFDVNTVLTYTDSLNGTTIVNQNYRIHYPLSQSGGPFDFTALGIVGTRGVDTWQTSSNSTGSIFLNHGDTTGTVLWAQYQQISNFVGSFQFANIGNASSSWPFMAKCIGVQYSDSGTQLMNSAYNLTDNRGNSNVNATMSVASTNRAWAQSFQSDGQPIRTAYFVLNRISPTGTTINGFLTASLWAHSGSFGTSTSWPSGSRLASSSVDYLDLSTLDTNAGSWITYGFTFNDYPTTSGSYYWIGLETPSVTGGTAIAQILTGTGGGSPHPGRMARFDGSVWTNVADDLRFIVFSKADVIESLLTLGGARKNFCVS